ncbi:MAG: SMP-30/gluconolactonase/LRE family protein [Dehalococcoidia bacterium]
MRIFADDLGEPEGPVLLPDGTWAVVEMRPDRGHVTQLTDEGRSRRVLAKTGRPNGLAVDADGVLWITESMNPPSLLRLRPGGEPETLLTAAGDDPFLFPNDLCFGPDGALYMTDSGFFRPGLADIPEPERVKVKVDGRVFRIDRETLGITRIDSWIPMANGIAFGPDNDLYVSASFSGMVYRYRWDGSGFGPREDFANVRNPEKRDVIGRPDGMAFAENGDLYVTVAGQSDVTVVRPDGTIGSRIQLEEPNPTNVAFGPAGSQQIYVTAKEIGRLEVHDVGVDGLPLMG